MPDRRLAKCRESYQSIIVRFRAPATFAWLDGEMHSYRAGSVVRMDAQYLRHALESVPSDTLESLSGMKLRAPLMAAGDA